MNKEEFLDILERELSDVPREEKEYFIRYCREMVEDRMEEGIPEEEAVGTREELDAAIRAFRQENGFGQQGTRTDGADSVGYWTMAAGHVRSVFIDISNIRIICVNAESDQIEIRYPVDEDRIVTEKILTDDGQMHLRMRGKERKVFFGLLSWNWIIGDHEPVTVCIPSDFPGEIRLLTSNASIVTEHGGTPGDLRIETSNARIELRSAIRQGGSIFCRTSNGRIEYDDLSASHIELTTGNGRVTGKNLTSAGNAFLKTSNGPFHLGNMTAEEISLSTSNGRIALEHGDARRITLSTSNGNVRAHLAGNIREYGIESSTSHGDNTLPSNMSGGERKLNVSTSNGSINVTFDEV